MYKAIRFQGAEIGKVMYQDGVVWRKAGFDPVAFLDTVHFEICVLLDRMTTKLIGDDLRQELGTRTYTWYPVQKAIPVFKKGRGYYRSRTKVAFKFAEDYKTLEREGYSLWFRSTEPVYNIFNNETGRELVASRFAPSVDQAFDLLRSNEFRHTERRNLVSDIRYEILLVKGNSEGQVLDGDIVHSFPDDGALMYSFEIEIREL